jgi:hypothetical protein
MEGAGMLDKPWEYWATLLAMAIWTGTRDAEKDPLKRRLAKTATSVLLTAGLSPSVAAYTGLSEIWTAIIVMSVGLLALDTATALVSDREFIKEVIRKKMGVKDGND